MMYVAVILSIISAVVLLFCGIALLRRPEPNSSFSRLYLSVFSLVSSAFSVIFVFRIIAGTGPVAGPFLEPEHVFVPLFVQLIFMVYPLTMLKPVGNPIKVYAFLFAPSFLIAITGFFAGINYTQIESFVHLMQNISKPDVLFRLFALLVELFYCFALFFVSYDYRQSSANRSFLMCYAVGFGIMGILNVSAQMFHSYPLLLVHQFAWIIIFVALTYFELKVRLAVPSADDDKPQFNEPDRLWQQIVTVIEVDEEWRNPDLSLSYLTTKVLSNRTYVSEAFKRNTGMNFIEYISRKRIGYVTQILRDNPKADVRDLFFHVGYRAISTAWDNFHRVTGKTVSEFLDELK